MMDVLGRMRIWGWKVFDRRCTRVTDETHDTHFTSEADTLERAARIAC